jgi:hypothetical protein
MATHLIGGFHMNAVLRVAVLGLMLGSCMNAIAQTCPPSIVPPVYDRQVAVSDIANAIFMGDWRHALKLASDYARQYLSDCKNAPEITAAIMKASAKLSAIVNDPGKTETQKRAEIYRLIDESVLPYQLDPKDPVRAPVNELNATYLYSLEYGIARISFDVETRDDLCAVQWNVAGVANEFDLYAGQPLWTVVWSRIDSRHVRTPNIYVFRQVEGFPEEQVTKFSGQLIGGRTGYYAGKLPSSFNYPDVKWQTARQLAWDQLVKRFNGTPASPVTRTSLDLPTAPYLQRGRAVAYRIVAEWPQHYFPKGNACEQSFFKQSLIYIDADRDSRADIVPAADYARHLGRLYAPVISTVLDD